MTDIKRIGDSGIHTVEGQVSGARAARLTKQREKEKAAYEAIKSQIKVQNTATVGRIDDKFNAASNSLETEFNERTIGLHSAADFRKAREYVDSARRENEQKDIAEKAAMVEKKRIEREKKRKKAEHSLSFADDDIEGLSSSSSAEEKADTMPIKKVTKDPLIDADFLPDRERDRRIQEEREKLAKEWHEQQAIMKNEMLEVVYSFWDGSGHRKSIQVKKGTTIGKFLEMVKNQLSAEFSDLRTTSPDNLVYIKEDLIIPHHFSFYDLIVTKARGKSGPLFHFDVHEDVRLINDSRVEKDESHPGKVVERRWYEKNKHIFPASRWEIYDPSVKRDKYTIHGDEVNAK